MKPLAILLALTSYALAADGDILVKPQEQSVWLEICKIAARDPNIDIEVNASIASSCVNWKGRMQAAAQPKPAESAPEPQK